MADKKISQLTAVTMPLAETEVLPIVQSGTTKKVTVAELTTLIKHTMTMDSTNPLQFGDAGYTASIAYNGDGSLRITPRSGYPVQIQLGNLKFSHAGYGIDFSANGGDVLTQYDEGTWTPVRNNFTEVVGSGSITATGTYTRIGRMVQLYAQIVATGGATIAGVAGTSYLTGCPFTPASAVAGAWVDAGSENAGGFMLKRTTDLWVVATSWSASSSTWVFSTTFFV